MLLASSQFSKSTTVCFYRSLGDSCQHWKLRSNADNCDLMLRGRPSVSCNGVIESCLKHGCSLGRPISAALSTEDMKTARTVGRCGRSFRSGPQLRAAKGHVLECMEEDRGDDPGAPKCTTSDRTAGTCPLEPEVTFARSSGHWSYSSPKEMEAVFSNDWQRRADCAMIWDVSGACGRLNPSERGQATSARQLSFGRELSHRPPGEGATCRRTQPNGEFGTKAR